MDDDYHDYMNAVTDEDRQEIQNKYSDKEMFDSMIDWHRINHRKNAYPPIQEQLDMIYRCGLERWKSEIEDIKSKYPDLTRGYTTRFHEMQKIETTQTQLKENLQTTLADLQTTRTQLGETRTDLQTTRTQLEETRTDLQTTRTHLEGELQSTRTDLTETRTQLETTQTQLETTRTQLETTRTQLGGDLQSAHNQLQNTRTELEITNLKLRNAEARIGTLEQTMTSILSKLNV
jgi:chromosome segregation ATPase